MDEVQPNIWSACSGRLSGTKGRCGLPWVLKTQGTCRGMGIWSAEEELMSVGRTGFSTEKIVFASHVAAMSQSLLFCCR